MTAAMTKSHSMKSSESRSDVSSIRMPRQATSGCRGASGKKLEPQISDLFYSRTEDRVFTEGLDDVHFDLHFSEFPAGR